MIEQFVQPIHEYRLDLIECHLVIQLDVNAFIEGEEQVAVMRECHVDAVLVEPRLHPVAVEELE